MIRSSGVIPEARRARRQEPALASLGIADDGSLNAVMVGEGRPSTSLTAEPEKGKRRGCSASAEHDPKWSPASLFAKVSWKQKIRLLAVCVLAVIGMSGAAAADPYDVSVLQGLDKVTGRVSTIEAPVGDTVRFGALEIIARTCDKRPPEETPESTAFLDIWEIRPGEAAVSLFRGWMFASSPALSAMEHPVYDVWLLDCNTPSSAPAKAPAGGSR